MQIKSQHGLLIMTWGRVLQSVCRSSLILWGWWSFLGWWIFCLLSQRFPIGCLRWWPNRPSRAVVRTCWPMKSSLPYLQSEQTHASSSQASQGTVLGSVLCLFSLWKRLSRWILGLRYSFRTVEFNLFIFCDYKSFITPKHVENNIRLNFIF